MSKSYRKKPTRGDEPPRAPGPAGRGKQASRQVAAPSQEVPGSPRVRAGMPMGPAAQQLSVIRVLS